MDLNLENQQTRGLVDDEFQEYDPSILTQDSRPQQTTHQYRSQSTNYNSNYVINTNNNNIRHHSINYITHNNGNYYSSINDIKDYGDDSSIDSISNDDDWKNTVLKLINKYNGKISNNIEIGDINLNDIDVNSSIQNEIDKLESLQMHLKRQQNISNQTQTHNNELYKKVNELKKEKKTLKLEIQKEKSKIQNSINNTNNNNNNNNKNNNNNNNGLSSNIVVGTVPSSTMFPPNPPSTPPYSSHLTPNLNHLSPIKTLNTTPIVSPLPNNTTNYYLNTNPLLPISQQQSAQSTISTGSVGLPPPYITSIGMSHMKNNKTTTQLALNKNYSLNAFNSGITPTFQSMTTTKSNGSINSNPIGNMTKLNIGANLKIQMNAQSLNSRNVINNNDNTSPMAQK